MMIKQRLLLAIVSGAILSPMILTAIPQVRRGST
jgi:hypothetical protein